MRVLSANTLVDNLVPSMLHSHLVGRLHSILCLALPVGGSIEEYTGTYAQLGVLMPYTTDSTAAPPAPLL